MAEGIRAVEELLRSPLDVRGALIDAARLDATPRGTALRDRLAERNVETAEVTERDFASAAETDSPQGILAVAGIPLRRLAATAGELPAAARLAVLDGIQDPGNVGTILRTAAAFEAATVALPGTVDLWNAKVVRSSMGAHFHHPAVSATWDELDEFRHDRGAALWVADSGGTPLDAGSAPRAPLCVVLGNEGSGPSAQARERADQVVSLPIAPGVESLNVAVAAGILLYELRA